MTSQAVLCAVLLESLAPPAPSVFPHGLTGPMRGLLLNLLILNSLRNAADVHQGSIIRGRYINLTIFSGI